MMVHLERMELGNEIFSKTELSTMTSGASLFLTAQHQSMLSRESEKFFENQESSINQHFENSQSPLLASLAVLRGQPSATAATNASLAVQRSVENLDSILGTRSTAALVNPSEVDLPNSQSSRASRLLDNTLDSSDTQNFSRRVRSRSVFRTIVLNKKVQFSVFEQPNEIVDGDIVRIKFNGLSRRVVLTPRAETFRVNLRPGANVLRVTAIGEGAIRPNTVQVNFGFGQVVDGRPVYSLDLRSGQSQRIVVRLPEIVLSRNECNCPQSIQHIVDRQGGNPDILTIDRDGAERRRRQSLRNYRRRGGRSRPGFDLDEYVPAVFLENRGAASVRPIPSSDNRRAGNRIGFQINNYRRRIIGGKVRLPDGANVVLRVAP